MKANDMQVGGEHYRSEYQHWDFVIATAMGYLEGNATRYISRWRRKGGMEDLKKALHYVNKLLEVLPQVVGRRGERIVGSSYARVEAEYFCSANRLYMLERRIVVTLATWEQATELEGARDDILLLMDEAKEPIPVPATDSNKHAIGCNDWPESCFDEEIPF